MSSYILWLPSWYPNKLQPYNGDFVQRHARAVSLYHRLEVLHVVKDEHGTVTTTVKFEVTESDNLRETIIYYHPKHGKIPILGRLWSHCTYLRLLAKAVKQIVAKEGVPQLLHVYIALKAGISGSKFAKKMRIPYVVSEQATLYLPETKSEWLALPWLVRRQAGKIFRGAAAVMSVSTYLGNALVRRFAIPHPTVIPNVVDTRIFNYQGNNAEAPVFLHVSNLTMQKNADAIIEAFAIVKKKGYDFRLEIAGSVSEGYKKKIREAGLEDYVFMHAEMPQQELAELYKKSKALVLFSRYETFGCVIVEAHASGLPTILSDIPVHYENADESNSLFARAGEAHDLAEKIITCIEKTGVFNRQEIATRAAAAYNFKVVGAQFSAWYHTVLK